MLDIRKMVKIGMAKKNLNGVQIGASMGKSKNYVSEALNRANGMRIDTLEGIASAMGYNLRLSLVDKETQEEIKA